jgi:hypothetical protein
MEPVMTDNHSLAADPLDPGLEGTHNFTEENCPTLLLWRGLKPLTFEADSLQWDTLMVRNNLVLLDDAPRHDTILSDEILAKIQNANYRDACSRTVNRLQHSISVLDEACGKLKHVFRGETKVKYYDRLARHRAEAQNLLMLFSQLPRDDSNQPFSIRQRMLAPLYHSFTDLLDQITPLRRSVMKDPLPGELFIELKEAEAELFRLRSCIARWRDNPSQKLGNKMEDCLKRVEAVHKSLVRMKQNAQYECQLLGIQFYNRQGLARVERC